MPNTQGLYIHVPFCEQRCIYCDFYSTTSAAQLAQTYVQNLCDELKARGGAALHTLYIGGGTPSVLSLEQLHAIMRQVKASFDTHGLQEITIEVNPDDVDEDFARGLRQIGFNRISMGVQTFPDESLRFLRRRHTGEEAKRAVRQAHAAGFENITIDLIYGLPQQTLQDWQKDVDEALRLPITHLSSYALIYEEGTALYVLKKQAKVFEAPDELQLDMFNYLIDATAQKGFEHYEISNFALPQRRAQHNSSYWQGLPYIGCGPGAHSYDGGSTRRYNLPSLRDYVKTPHDVPFTEEHLTPTERYEELILTRLRMVDGLLWEDVPTDFLAYLRHAAAPYIAKGWLISDERHLRLSRQGVFLSDTVFSDLI